MDKGLIAVLAFGLLGGCTSGELSVPEPVSVTEVPYGGADAPYGYNAPPATGAASTSSPDLSALPEGVQRAPAGVTTATAAPGIGRPLDTDTLNLMQTTLEEQKIDAAIAQQKLDEDRSKLVIVQPGRLPDQVSGVNIALFARQSTNAVGERIYSRDGGLGFGSACRKFRSGDDAQRAFLAAGGPTTDQYGLDPDGDGFACDWDPKPYRELPS
ncbi:hypothetical protein [Amaricoccus solimangrovi]|uniref:Excalibur calcium-binding domain-containing protein n=1 Tax=Amaricoccus solimangrovi TaxID=2589815 RepID=A0A501WR15_9RHOB|nr:hypothetical protein [Amaricoccus solimangrovi]TPE50514.1 hypothetical protein FJM51_12030 [Amaricoccus solimangrovi]